jgi:hypothetical protein
MSEVLLLAFSLVGGLSLLFLAVYFIITLSDLECDYINARTCCAKLNQWVMPEIVAHVLIAAAVLLAGHWLLFLLNIPLTSCLIYRHSFRPSSSLGVYDQTEIYNRQLMKKYMRESLIKLGLHLLFFFLYLYSMIVALVS